MNSQNNTESNIIKKKKPLEFLYNKRWKRVLLIIISILLCLAIIASVVLGVMWISGKNALLGNDGQSMTAPSGYDVDIDDDDVVCEAARYEIIRRYYNTKCDVLNGIVSNDAVFKIELIMKQAGVSVEDRKVVKAANDRAGETGMAATAIQLPDGQLIVGKTSDLLGASAAALLNALKTIAGIDKEVKLISPEVIEPIQSLKINHFGNHNPRLHTDEALIALSFCATTNADAKKAFDKLSELKGGEVHSSVILSQIDKSIFKKLGLNLTCEPVYQTKKLYHG